MTNFEFYADEINAVKYDFAITKNGSLTYCGTFSCNKCEFYGGDSCTQAKIEWLYEEHIEQPKLTQNERKLCEILKDGYLSRTAYGTLVWASNDSSEQWAVNTYPFNDCDFSFIKNGDEPWSVEELLKLEVME